MHHIKNYKNRIVIFIAVPKGRSGKKKTSKKGSKVLRKETKPINRRPWSAHEKEAVNRRFGHFIQMLKVPGKGDIDLVLKKEKCLSKRSWRNVKDAVHNIIMKKKKC